MLFIVILPELFIELVIQLIFFEQFQFIQLSIELQFVELFKFLPVVFKFIELVIQLKPVFE